MDIWLNTYTIREKEWVLLDYQAMPSFRDVHSKKNYGTHVIKLDIAPKAYPLGQHLFTFASNNMFYRHSQWDKRHTICVVNLMPQDTKIEFLNRSCLGSNLQSSGWVSDTLPVCHICLIQIVWNWIYLELNIFLAFFYSACLLILHSTKISAMHVIKLRFAPKTYPKGNTSTVNDKMYCLGD